MDKDEFRDWRKRLGMTQIQAANALGMSRRSIIDYEHGQPIPRVVELASQAVEASNGRSEIQAGR